MGSLARRAAPLEGDLSLDVRNAAEGALLEGVRALTGGTVDAAVYRFLASLTPEAVLRLAEESDALEVLRGAEKALRESRRLPANVVRFRRSGEG